MALARALPVASGSTTVRAVARLVVGHVFLAVYSGTAMACQHVAAPYTAAPSAEELLRAAQPPVSALVVANGGIVANRVARADFSFLAQAPVRLRGTVTKAGQELVSFAMHEDGYTIRNKLEGDLAPGFYAGQDSACALSVLLGVPLAPSAWVAATLGGAPILDVPFSVRGQRWNPKTAREELTLVRGDTSETIGFASRGQAPAPLAWEVREVSLAQRNNWRWSVSFANVRIIDGVRLPTKVEMRAPGKRRNQLLVLTLDGINIDPPWAHEGPSGSPSTSETSPHTDDSWQDDGEWEGDDAAEYPEAAAIKPPVTPIQQQRTDRARALFVLASDGLTMRGDLCGQPRGT